MVTPAAPQARRHFRQSNLPLLLVGFCTLLVLFFKLFGPGSSVDDGSGLAPAKLSADSGIMNGFQPVSCVDMVEASQRNNSDANKNRLFLRYTSEFPQFWLSLHSPSYDNVRWATMRFGKYYEKIQTAAFRDILVNSTNPRLIDVGGNIGWFSLLSAALGAKVDVFEPNPKNYLRTCESLCINNWLDEPCPAMGDLSVSGARQDGRLRIFPAGVGRREETLTLALDSVTSLNPGAAKIRREVDDPRIMLGEQIKVPIVPLDKLAVDLGWYDETIDILKIDVEGFELDVILGAKKFLKSNVVKHIFMEGDVKTKTNRKNFETVVTAFADAGYMVFKIGGFSGPQHTDVPPMDENITENLHFKCSGSGGPRKRDKCNLWWKLPSA